MVKEKRKEKVMRLLARGLRITKPIGKVGDIQTLIERAKSLGATKQLIEDAENIAKFEGAAGAAQYLKSQLTEWDNSK